MDCKQESDLAGGNLVEFQSGNTENAVNQEEGLGSIDQAVWAAEVVKWKGPDGREVQSALRNEVPNKRARNSPLVDLTAANSSKIIAKMLYKTKPCKFQFGCPFMGNCNYAHSIEELRKPPPNWQEFVAACKEEHVASSEPREVIQILVMEPSGETQASVKKQHCSEFSSEEGCGENRIFSYDSHLNERESVAICLLPGTEDGDGGSGSRSTFNASNWKTIICHHWKFKGHCSFGSWCRYAHGVAELQCPPGGSKRAFASPSNAPVPTVPYSYHCRAPSKKLPKVMLKTGELPVRIWNGPNKISKA